MDRDVVCQLPPEARHPPYIAARLKKTAYGINDASRRRWNVLDRALCSYGMVPMRADRCVRTEADAAYEKMLDPIAGSLQGNPWEDFF